MTSAVPQSAAIGGAIGKAAGFSHSPSAAAGGSDFASLLMQAAEPEGQQSETVETPDVVATPERSAASNRPHGLGRDTSPNVDNDAASSAATSSDVSQVFVPVPQAPPLVLTEPTKPGPINGATELGMNGQERATSQDSKQSSVSVTALSGNADSNLQSTYPSSVKVAPQKSQTMPAGDADIHGEQRVPTAKISTPDEPKAAEAEARHSSPIFKPAVPVAISDDGSAHVQPAVNANLISAKPDASTPVPSDPTSPAGDSDPQSRDAKAIPSSAVTQPQAPAPVPHQAAIPEKGETEALPNSVESLLASQKPAEKATTASVRKDVESIRQPGMQVGKRAVEKRDEGSLKPVQPEPSEDVETAITNSQVTSQTIGKSTRKLKGDDIAALQPSTPSGESSRPVVDESKGTNGSLGPRTSARPYEYQGGPTTYPEAQAEASAAPRVLHSAKLLERVGQSELRVGLQGSEFGNIDIRTSMARSQLSAQISVERGELARALTAELPSLQHRLAEQQITTAEVHVENQFNGDSQSSGGRQQEAPRTQSRNDFPTREDHPFWNTPLESSDVSSRLDIHI